MSARRYTIIYTVGVGYGMYLVQHARVRTRNLKKLLERDEEYSNVWLIFEGWPKLEGEYATLDEPVEVEVG